MGAAIFYSTIHTKQFQRSKKKFVFAFAWCEWSIMGIFTVSIEMLSCCLSRYYCIVNNRGIVAFINSSLYSCETYKQVKEMVILHLFIEHHYKYIVSIIRERHVLTLHLSTANCRRKLTTGCCCKNVAARYVILPGRVNTTVPRVVAYFNALSWAV